MPNSEIEKLAEKYALILCGKELQDSIDNRIKLLTAALSEMRGIALKEAAEIAKGCKEPEGPRGLGYVVEACNLQCDEIAAAISGRIGSL